MDESEGDSRRGVRAYKDVKGSRKGKRIVSRLRYKKICINRYLNEGRVDVGRLKGF